MAITLEAGFEAPPQDPNLPETLADPGAANADDSGLAGGLPGGDTPGPDPAAVADIPNDTGTDGTGTNRRGLPGPGVDSTQQQMLDSANAVNASAGQPYPGDLAAMQGNILAGDFRGSINRLGDPTGPAPNVSAPNPGGSGGLPGGSGAGQLSAADWEKDFRAANGYFDPTYNSRDAFLHEAQMGDTAIRGATGGGDQLAKMAQYDSDARRILDAITGAPDFYHSQNAADWARLHNADVANQLADVRGVGPQQAAQQGFNGRLGAPSQPAPPGANAAWLRSQIVNDVTNPVDNAHALLSDSLRSGLVDALANLGATNFRMGFDNAGNMTLNYTSKSGTPESVKADLVNMASALDTLRQRVAATQAPPAPPGGGGGGGYSPRAPRGGGGYAPRGGGGGAGDTFPAGNAMIDQSAAGGGVLLPGNNVKQGYYPDVQAMETAKGGFVNPSGATVYYDSAGDPYGYYYGGKNAVDNIQGERRGLPY